MGFSGMSMYDAQFVPLESAIHQACSMLANKNNMVETGK